MKRSLCCNSVMRTKSWFSKSSRCKSRPLKTARPKPSKLLSWQPRQQLKHREDAKKRPKRARNQKKVVLAGFKAREALEEAAVGVARVEVVWAGAAVVEAAEVGKEVEEALVVKDFAASNLKLTGEEM